jgi:FixJ family two-component response regulator
MSLPLRPLDSPVSLICVVDDDESVRESMQGLLASIGYAVQTFPSALAFLESDCVARTDCLILDVRMPGMTGPELQRELSARRQDIPIVFITSYGYEDVRPHIRSERVVNYLHKPFSEEALLGAIRTALEPD